MGQLRLRESCDLPKDLPASLWWDLEHHPLPCPGPDIFLLNQHPAATDDKAGIPPAPAPCQKGSVVQSP